MNHDLHGRRGQVGVDHDLFPFCINEVFICDGGSACSFLGKIKVKVSELKT